MKKMEIVERVAGEAGFTKQAAQVAVGAVFASIGEALAKGENVSILGFSRFSRKDRPAREGEEPAHRRTHHHGTVGQRFVQDR